MAIVDLEEVIDDETWKDLSMHVQEAFSAVQFWYPDEPEASEDEVYQRAIKGHCMTCDGTLGPLTMMVINQAGIVMIFCSGQCLSDMQVVGWLEEKYEYIVNTIKYRGGKVDPEEEEQDGGVH